MPVWIWWIIWSTLTIGALATWGYLLFSLGKPLKSLAESAQSLNEVSQGFAKAASEKPVGEHPFDNLDDSPEQLQAEREVLLDRRRERKEDRARRLRRRVKNIKLEGRFKDVR